MVDFTLVRRAIYGSAYGNMQTVSLPIQKVGVRFRSFITRRAYMKTTQGRESYILSRERESVTFEIV